MNPKSYLFDGEPGIGRVLGANDQADVVLGSQTVVNGADTGVGICGEVDPGQASG
jgi:hypothetical protein